MQVKKKNMEYKTFCVLILLTIISNYINYKLIRLPKLIGIILIILSLSIITIILEKIGINIEYTKIMINKIKFNETFLNFMLSFLLFASTLQINSIELLKYKLIITLLSTISVLLSTLFISFSIYGITQLLHINIPITYCITFGVLISPTDPVIVLKIFKITKIPKFIELKIKGEALFNDGTSIVFFFVALSSSLNNENTLFTNSIITYFIKQYLGGFCFGFLIGNITLIYLKKIHNCGIIMTITISIVSSGYIFAHILSISGPIYIVISGLIIKNSLKNIKLSKIVLKKIVLFWKFIDEFLNTILLVLIGLELINIKLDYYTIYVTIILIIVVIISRLISISIPIYIFSNKSNIYMLNIITWAGLRGGISLALSLNIEEKLYNFITTITYLIVIFSIIIQGITIKDLIKIYIYKYNSNNIITIKK